MVELILKYKPTCSNTKVMLVTYSNYKLYKRFTSMKIIMNPSTLQQNLHLFSSVEVFKWTTMLNGLYRILQDNIMHMNKSYLRRSSKWENKQLELTCLWSSLISHVYSHTCYTRITEKKRTKQNNMNNLKKSKFQNGYNNLHK